ncbi:amidohydrolase family protein [Streptomyces boninensis]|uniref:amidohydrolase family protein n=1 Tax=Streptomyces boninensis TaxID=2039455 RepID=UPI003B22391E
MLIDAHVRIGDGREVALSTESLLADMDDLGIDRTLIAPSERCIAYDNREGNARTVAAARASGGRLLAYAVANPWRGEEATAELERARDEGAVALAVDPVLQGFDLLDGLLDPLLRRAGEWGWPVYVRTGTPPSSIPLPLAELALLHPDVAFIMGKSGGTDFWIDANQALLRAPNLYADTAYAPWDSVLTGFARTDGIGTGRVIFSTDSPYTLPSIELGRVREWPIPAGEKAAVLGGTMAGLLQ